jgi:hypothetical protein
VVGECAGKRLGFVERDVAVSHAGVFPEVTGAETKPHPVLVGWRPLKDATRRKISPFILGQISRRIWMERRGHVDRVADHGLGVAHAGLLADQHLHGRRNGAEIPAILSAVLAEADQGVAQERDPLARVPNVVDVSARGNQVMPGATSTSSASRIAASAAAVVATRGSLLSSRRGLPVGPVASKSMVIAWLDRPFWSVDERQEVGSDPAEGVGEVVGH